MTSKTNYKQTEIGEIPQTWELVELRDVLSEKGYIRGPFGSALRRPELKSEGIPVYEQQHAIYGVRDFRYYIDEEKFEELKRFQVKVNDLIISCSGTLGKVSIITDEDPKGIISQALLALRPDTEKILPDYLKYFFTSRYGFTSITSRSTGSVQVNIANRQIIELIKLALPSIHEQQIIILILSSLDDKIELNRKMNNTLEEIGKALFKQWFVDFEFPDENGRPYKSSGGKMVNSELGEIPEGWEAGHFGNVVENFDSKRIPLSNREREKRKGDFRYYGATGVMDHVNDFIFDGIYLLVGEDGTVITNKETAVTQYVWGKFWVNNHAHVLKGKNGFSTEVLKLFLEVTNIAPYITGAVQPKLNQNNLNSIPVVLPKKEILAEFSGLIDLLFSKYRQTHDEIERLTSIRDSLLPRLMSGKLRVRDYEN